MIKARTYQTPQIALGPGKRILPGTDSLNHSRAEGILKEGIMEVIKINAIQRVNENISILPLNLQDHLVLVDSEVVGMYHEGHETARILRNSNYQVAVLHLEKEGFEIQYTNEPFILSQWTNDEEKTCGEIIYNSKQ